jgi:hypothetical protein
MGESLPMMPSENLKVCVVGAGPAGLAMGRALLDAEIAFDILERNPGVGGIWNPDHPGSPVYQSAHFISSKGAPMSTFREFPFGDSVAIYPSHREVLNYLDGFADQAGIRPHIRLLHDVRRAELVDGQWHVTLVNGNVRIYSDLVCASGTLWDPNLPDMPGTFSGTVRHSASYRSASEVAGKTLLVVGAGNSAVDIACDAARSAKRVLLSVRRGYWFVPKFIRGIPADIFFRMPDGLPSWAHPPDAADLLELLVGNPSSYGLPTPDHPPFASHPIMNNEVLHHIGHGRIMVRQPIADCAGHEVRFAGGTCDHVDEIIFATGYRATVPYLAPGVLTYESGNRPEFWLRLFHRSIPNLFGLGFIETNSSVFRLFDLGAELIARYLRARSAGMPGAADLAAAIAGETEPDLTGGITRVASARHVGYVDSRTYERALAEAATRYLDGAEVRA